MPKTVSICIDGKDVEVTLRRLKKKELKPLVEKLAEKLDGIAALVGGGDIVKALPGFLGENIDFICGELVLPFTSLTPEQLDETDVTDIVGLLRGLLLHNGIDTGKLVNFFKGNPAKQQITDALGFAGVSVPS